MKLLVIAALLFLVLPFCSAEIMFSEPASIYSAGDEISITTTVNPEQARTDFLTIDLLCESGTAQLYRNPLTIKVDESREVVISSLLTPTITGDLEGDCLLSGTFGNEKGTSLPFELTRAINAEVQLATEIYDPSATITLSGNASKGNGQLLEGFIEATLLNGPSLSGVVSAGTYTLDMVIPDNYPAGEHTLEVRIYDKDESGVILNEGVFLKTITVNSVLRRIDVVITNATITPPGVVEFMFQAYDQSDVPLAQEVQYRIYFPDAAEIVATEGQTTTDKMEIFTLQSQDVPGYWKIEGVVGELSSKKTFYVEEHVAVSFEVLNDSLVVTNTGNVPYAPTELTIVVGDKTQNFTDLILGLGEKRTYTFEGPAGTYDLTASDGTNNFNSPITLEQEKGFLFGFKNPAVIGIKEGSSSAFSMKFLWIALLVLIAATFVTNIVLRKRSILFGEKKTKEATSMGGRKETANVVAIHLKHSPQLQSAVDETLAPYLNAGAKIYTDDDYKIIVYTPHITKSETNELLAIQTAEEIQHTFETRNRLMKDKIEFGIAAHRGEVISEVSPGSHKITSVGNLIPSAKKLAGLSREQVLLSNELYRTVAGSVKADKQPLMNAWKLTKVIDRTEHLGFIKSFLKRQDKK